MSETVKACPKCDSTQYSTLTTRHGVNRRIKSEIEDGYYCRQCKEGFKKLKTRKAKHPTTGREPDNMEKIRQLREEMQ